MREKQGFSKSEMMFLNDKERLGTAELTVLFRLRYFKELAPRCIIYTVLGAPNAKEAFFLSNGFILMSSHSY